ncbi:MAG: pentapeptide repeat-containing protein, partial [Parachlamydia sp.]|nr:pentapeptide repeat-containing protein [Parachlamydia sp.]
ALIKYFNSESFCEDEHRLTLEANWCQNAYHGEGRKHFLRALLASAIENPERAIAAGNALSILVKAGENCCGSNLNRLHITNANISDGNFKDAKFHDAVLKNIVAHRINLQGADLKSATLENVNFGIWFDLFLEEPLTLLTLSPDGKYLVGATGNKVHIWIPQTAAVPYFAHHQTLEKEVRFIQFSKDSYYLAIICQQTVEIYEMSGKKKCWSFKFEQTPLSIHFALDSSYCAVVFANRLQLMRIVKNAADSFKFGPGASCSSFGHLLFSSFKSSFCITSLEETYSALSFYRYNESSCIQERSLVIPFVVHAWQLSSHGYRLIAICPDNIRVCLRDTLAEPFCSISLPAEPLWVHLDDNSSTLSIVFARGMLLQYRVDKTPKLIQCRKIFNGNFRRVVGVFQENSILVETEFSKIVAIEIFVNKIKNPINDEILAIQFARNEQNLFLFTASTMIKYDPSTLDQFSTQKTKRNYSVTLEKIRTASTVREGAHHLVSLLRETPFSLNSFYIKDLARLNPSLQGLTVDSGGNYLAFYSPENEVELWSLTASRNPWFCSLQLNRVSSPRPDMNSSKAIAIAPFHKEGKEFSFAICSVYEKVPKIFLYEHSAFSPNHLKVEKVITIRAPLAFMIFSLPHRQLFAIDQLQTLKSWSLGPGNNTESCWHLSENVITFTIHEESHLLIYTTNQKEIFFVDLLTTQLLLRLREEWCFREIRVSASGSLLCAIAEEGFSFCIWDLKKEHGRLIATLRRKFPTVFDCRDAYLANAHCTQQLNLLLKQNGAIWHHPPDFN